ncbi:ABC transporter permease [Mycoplasmatota bacterium]|nr:ABC transporter permease [Mycoplasmatota bacterium]
MNFKSMIRKNFIYHIKQYLAFFLCISFSIMVFFIYSIIYYNPALYETIRYTTIDEVMKMALFIIGIFSVFFIHYAYQAFIKSKYHEIGLFITLGMTSKEINRMNRIEYFIIMCISIVAAIISGVVFSKLFYMIFLSIIDLKDIPFILNYKSFLLTIILFSFIFTVVLIISHFKINKFQVIELLKKEKMSEINDSNNPLLGFIGILLIIVSYLLTYLLLVKNVVNNPLLFLILFFTMNLIGLYLIIKEFGQIILRLIKKEKYHQNILFYSELKQHFKQYKNILFVTTLLIAVAIYFIGLTFSVYATQLEEVKKVYPYDLMLIETGWSKSLSDEEITQIFEKHHIDKEEKTMEFMHMILYKTTTNQYGIWGDTVIVSENMYNQLSQKNLDVKKDHAVAISFEDGSLKWFEKEEDIVFKDQQTNRNFQFKFQEEKIGYHYNINNYQLQFMIIIDDANYNQIVRELGSDRIERFRMFKLDHWMNSKPLVLDFVNAVKAKNPEKIENQTLQQLYNDWSLMPSSRVLAYENNMRNASCNLFVMCFIGITFSISIGVVITLKLFNDLPNQKKRYEKIKKIGSSDVEMKKPIFSELKVIFFIPMILGLLIGFLYIMLTAMNFTFYYRVMWYSLMMMLVFIVIHFTFYFITKNKYIKQIIH